MHGTSGTRSEPTFQRKGMASSRRIVNSGSKKESRIELIKEVILTRKHLVKGENMKPRRVSGRGVHRTLSKRSPPPPPYGSGGLLSAPTKVGYPFIWRTCRYDQCLQSSSSSSSSSLSRESHPTRVGHHVGHSELESIPFSLACQTDYLRSKRSPFEIQELVLR